MHTPFHFNADTCMMDSSMPVVELVPSEKLHCFCCEYKACWLSGSDVVNLCHFLLSNLWDSCPIVKCLILGNVSTFQITGFQSIVIVMFGGGGSIFCAQLTPLCGFTVSTRRTLSLFRALHVLRRTISYCEGLFYDLVTIKNEVTNVISSIRHKFYFWRFACGNFMHLVS
jgi:hypothetical protein